MLVDNEFGASYHSSNVFVRNERRKRMRACFNPRVSAHAIERWKQRVDGNASADTARMTLERFLRHGRSRSTPRRWMKDVRQTPGLRFIYSEEHPGVCVLVKGNTALTVVTKSLCRPATQLRRVQPGRRGRPDRRPRIEGARRKSWYAVDEEEAA